MLRASGNAGDGHITVCTPIARDFFPNAERRQSPSAEHNTFVRGRLYDDHAKAAVHRNDVSIHYSPPLSGPSNLSLLGQGANELCAVH